MSYLLKNKMSYLLKNIIEITPLYALLVNRLTKMTRRETKYQLCECTFVMMKLYIAKMQNFEHTIYTFNISTPQASV